MRRMLARRLALIAAVISVSALESCRQSVPPPAAAAEPARLLTTDGDLAAHNFEAELAQAQRQHDARPADGGRARQLVERLLAHAQFFGWLADYDRADAVTARLVTLAPESGEAHALRARVDSALHRFPRALAELDAAERLRADPDAVLRARAAIWQATGAVDRALGYLRSWRRERPDFAAYAAEAAALADERDIVHADAMFVEARRHYTDVSPFAVAWVEFQEGHMWESAGRSDLARPLFESARSRLPVYASAGAHLARLVAAFGDPKERSRAAALLEGIVARSDDPEYLGQLGALYRQMGRTDEGDRLVARATDRYETLLRRHPEAFYDHGARFFLHVAGDPARARTLAAANLALRPTVDARDLYDEATRATSELTAQSWTAPSGQSGQARGKDPTETPLTGGGEPR